MNRLIFCILSLSILASCKKDDKKEEPTPTPETPKQEVVLFVFNASWDSLSGRHFKPFLERMNSQYPETPIVSMHISGPNPDQMDPLENQAVKDFNSWVPAEFHPDSSHSIPYCYFGANSTLKGIKKQDFTTLWSTMQQYIADSKAIPPVASVDFTTEIRNDSLLVYSTTTFHSFISYGYTMGIYVTEDDVAGSQFADGSGNPGQHDNVLRAMPTDPYGDFFYKNAAVGQKVNGLYKMKLAPDWNRSKLSVVAALWYNKGAAGIVLCNGKRKRVG